MIGSNIAGRYRIDAQLGVGGMGIVYQAHDTTLERDVALKVVAPHLVQVADARERFLREAQVLAGISHPNIVTVHDLVEDPSSGAISIVMELLQGGSLRQKIKAPDRPPFYTVAIQVTRALECAHRRGVLHRDIKPENIFVCSDKTIKLMDFGLARLVGAASNTQSNMAVGTVAYMAPEQLKGMKIDERADLYGLGVLLYEYLTGAPPFYADNPGAVLMKHLTELPAPLTSRIPGFRTDVNAIIMRLLAKEPGDRYHGASELREVLERALPGESTPLIARSGIHGAVAPAAPVQPLAAPTPSLAGSLPPLGASRYPPAPAVTRYPPRVTVARRQSNGAARALLLFVLVAIGAGAWFAAQALIPKRSAISAPPHRIARRAARSSRRRHIDPRRVHRLREQPQEPHVAKAADHPIAAADTQPAPKTPAPAPAIDASQTVPQQVAAPVDEDNLDAPSGDSGSSTGDTSGSQNSSSSGSGNSSGNPPAPGTP
ncbi:MAG TPA: serine/threonine-protein kinase [Chthonomonadales bacterium]|nr:serine/threonine-protein kinase [Chthonomonadales bacterium]